MAANRPAPVEFVPKLRPDATSDGDARMRVEPWSVFRLLFKSSVMTTPDGVTWRYSHPKLTAYAFFLLVSFGLLYGQYRTSISTEPEPTVPRYAWALGQVATGVSFAFATKRMYDFYGYRIYGIMTLQPHESLMGLAAFGVMTVGFLWLQKHLYRRERVTDVARRPEKERIVRFINDE